MKRLLALIEQTRRDWMAEIAYGYCAKQRNIWRFYGYKDKEELKLDLILAKNSQR
ncbi:hypothetical protein JCM19233_2929 [Vibrio astriarenae]|nr:hypothetical protein JCM19233_2929 [Vibrio sp. C7]